MYEILKAFFLSQDWVFNENEAKDMLFLSLKGDTGNFQCFADIDDVEKKFLFFSVCAANVPEEKRMNMAELLTRLNFGKLVGNFEMDFDDGEVRYKTSLYYKHIQPTIEIIEELVMLNVVTMDSCLAGIMGLIFSDLTPIQAVQMIEKED